MSFFDYPAPRVFAHRGGCALAPENTLPAFELGLKAGADGVELDVHLSRDGIVVVHHDDTLDRTTDATGPLAARTAAELARIDAGCRYRDGNDYPFRNQGVGIPTLADVLRRHPEIPLIVEMKVNSREMGEKVARDIREAGAVDRVCIAGYGIRAALAARAALPEADCSACYREVQLAVYRARIRWPVKHTTYGGYQVPEVAGGCRIVDPRFVRYAHEAGHKVQVWTVDEEADMRRLLGWGVDGLITNRPDVAVRVRDASLRDAR